MFNKLYAAAIVAKYRVENFLKEERGDVNVVAIVVLIGVAVLLAILFKEQIAKLLGNLFGTITNNATNAIEKSP